jgi:hypothetical protein
MFNCLSLSKPEYFNGVHHAPLCPNLPPPFGQVLGGYAPRMNTQSLLSFAYNCCVVISCLSWLAQTTLRVTARARCRAGVSTAISSAMIATTTSSSTSVNALCLSNFITATASLT